MNVDHGRNSTIAGPFSLSTNWRRASTWKRDWVHGHADYLGGYQNRGGGSVFEIVGKLAGVGLEIAKAGPSWDQF